MSQNWDPRALPTKKPPIAGRLSKNRVGDRLTLGELEAFAGAWLTGLLTFLHTRVTLDVASLLEGDAEFRIHLLQRAGDTMSNGSGLAGDATTIHVDRNVILVAQGDRDERGVGEFGKVLVREIVLKITTIGHEFTRAWSDADAGGGGLTTAGAQKYSSSFSAHLKN